MAISLPATQGDNVQQEILQAALRLYQKFGPNKVSMDDIATAIGRSRSSLYYYYKNRDEIFQAVLDSIVADVARDISKAVADADSLNNKLYTFCSAKLKTSADWKSVLQAMWLSMDSSEQTQRTKAMDALHKKLVYQEGIILNELFVTATLQKQMRPLNPAEQDMLVFIISSGLRGFRREIYDYNDPHDIKKAIQLLVDMIIKWLKG